MESISALELAIKKAQSEGKIIFFHDFGNHYDIPSTYDYFVFHTFSTIEVFCKELYKYCREKCDTDNGIMNYEFPCYLTNDDFLIKLDEWKNIYVMNFPKNIDISEHENKIIEYFEKRNIHKK